MPEKQLLKRNKPADRSTPDRSALRNYRKDLGLSQIEMAGKLDMVQGDYGRLERGEGMRLSKAVRIAQQVADMLHDKYPRRKKPEWRSIFVELWLVGEPDPEAQERPDMLLMDESADA